MASPNEDFYKPGDVIYASEPFAHMVYFKHREDFCDYCLKPTIDEMTICTECCFVFYCDSMCQEAAWEDHKFECEHLSVDLEETKRDLTRLVGKVLFKLKVKGQDYSETIGTYKRGYGDLKSHVGSMKSLRNGERDLQNLAAMVVDFVGLENIGSIENAMEAIGKVRYSRKEIDTDSEVDYVGTGLYLGASLFHHSCIPNAVQTFIGKRLEVRAIKPIPKGDMKKVTISYFPTLGNGILRKEVMGNFFRKCHCVDCSQPYGESVLTKIIDKEKSKEVIEFSGQILHNIDFLGQEAISRLMDPIDCIDCCLEKQEGVLGDTNLFRLRMFDRRAFMDPSYDSRKKYGEILLKNIRLAFGEASKEASVVLTMVLEAYTVTLDFEGTAKCLEQLEELNKIHGTTHNPYRGFK